MIGTNEDWDWDDETDYQNRWISPRRYLRARARSCAPGSYKHYDTLASNMYDNYQQTQKESSNMSALQRSTRATSESRESKYIRESSVVPEEKLSSFNRTYRLEDIKEGLGGSSGRGASDDFEQLGNYKITITPRATSWITPSRFWYSPQSQITETLLDAYNPSKYPDFVFGSYGVNSKGGISSRPISATQSYYSQYPLYTSKFESEYESGSGGSRLRYSSVGRDETANKELYRREFDSSRKSSDYRSSASNNRTARESSYAAAAAGTGDVGDYYYPGPGNSAARGASIARDYFADLDASGRGDFGKFMKRLNTPTPSGFRRYNPYEAEMDRPPLPKTHTLSKFFHYYIPKHYGGTPMLGGMLVPRGGDYSWRY